MPPPRRKNTATPIGLYRAQKGISQKAMAEQLCISQASLCRIENGFRNPTKPVIRLFEIIAEKEDWQQNETPAAGE